MTFIRIRDRLKDTKAQTESLKFLHQRDVFWGGWYRWLGAQTAGEPMTLAPLLSIAPLPPGHLVPVKFGQKAEKFLLYILRYLHSGCRNEWFSTCSLLLLQKVTILLTSHTYTHWDFLPKFLSLHYFTTLEGVLGVQRSRQAQDL